ncbi:efflux RND transporter periplasmic adaptor subunit [Anaerovorax odorimutans]|uniref:efflux RND transporter periplasmic adaptor subunit n=1 Tax=Anaerovorax odorimutans TaxID=109327 RepID=UPI0006846F7E|nr:efflux RND transporter periplasmic adaptor subunit [Anaerovorax odorimutans]
MNKFRCCVLLIFLMAFLLSGCISMREEAKMVSSKQGSVEENFKDNSRSEENELSGRAEAGESVSVVSKSTGKVAEVLANIGSEVKKGQVLLHLDSRELAANVDAAKANLEKANVAYKKYALENEKRARELKLEGAMSISDYDNNYASVLEMSESAVNLAQANLDKAQIVYNDSTVIAPMDGTVTEANVEIGELISAQTQAFKIVNLDQIKIEILVNEKKINSLKIGQNYKIELSAIPEKIFNGKITDISDAINTASKAYPVRITVENPEHLIKDGMFARVYLSSTDGDEMKSLGGEE